MSGTLKSVRLDPLFSKSLEKNLDCGAMNPCYLCGKELEGKSCFSIHVIRGGDEATLEDSDGGDPDGDMGWERIGPSCHRRFMKAYGNQ